MEAKARAYVERLLGQGRHTFTREEAEKALGTSRIATYHSLRRLQKTGWLVMPRRGFYLIVDPAYRALGALPPAAWIDELMAFHGARYYVGLLSAASLHGAAHQQPMEFQVVADKVLRPLTVGGVRMRFFFSRRVDDAVTERITTTSGYIPVSTPEMTAFDLIRYRKRGASIDHVATVIAELAERLDAGRLLAIAKQEETMPVVQRLGYLLDLTEHGALAEPLHDLVEDRKPRFVPLEPESSEAVSELNARWHVLVNTTIEVEV
jgi:predicted transcriptional regulator of viral defense system